MKRLLIIDGHAFVFRAYYAFGASNLTNSKTGKPSGATFGFLKCFLNFYRIILRLT